MSDFFSSIETALNQHGPESAIADLCSQLLAAGRYHELFDARLMQTRLKHQLPITQRGSLEELPEPVRSQVESDYLAACRESGWGLLNQGHLREAWMYLRPLGENEAVAAAIKQIEVTDDNAESLIEIALNEGMDTEFGMRLVLDRFGTCNAITAFDSVLAGRPLEARQTAAASLVRHLHRELRENVCHHIEQQEKRRPNDALLADLVSDRDWLFAEFSYHIDATHLASVVRAARIVVDADVLRLALDLTAYGIRLHENFQFRGDEPFVEIYPSHRLFFAAQLGQQIDEALEYFRARAESVKAEEVGTQPAETYIVLLARLGRFAEAAAAFVRLIPPGVSTQGLAPTLYELCGSANDFSTMLSRCRERNDPVGFAAAAISAHANRQNTEGN